MRRSMVMTVGLVMFVSLLGACSHLRTERAAENREDQEIGHENHPRAFDPGSRDPWSPHPSGIGPGSGR